MLQEHIEVRAELKRLFIQYCEFKEDTAQAHITHEGAKKLLKDAGVPSSRELVENVIGKTFRHKGSI